MRSNKLTNHMNNMSNIRPSNSKINQASYNSATQTRISQWKRISCNGFKRCVYSPVIRKSCSLKQIRYKFCLRKEATSIPKKIP
ncbi:hypothetical protein HanIR_Chr01g0033601 [Helianthus annuus]|nr:hypothetical protein HanIR_Chr01g0033601 [Helianthus annuus]